MIKKLLTVLTLAVVSTAMFAGDQLTFRYCGDPSKMAGFSAGYEVEAAIRIPASLANRYAGASITQLQIFFGQAATSTSIFIRTSDTDPGYSQAATFKVQSQNDITLTTPYVIGQNQDLYIGYHYKGGGNNAFYSMVLDNTSKAHPDGGYFRGKTGSGTYSAWYTVAGQGWGNFCIIAVIEGDNLPQADVAFLSLTAPQSFIDENESFSLQGEIKNQAAKSITEMEVSYQIGAEPKVFQTFNNLNIASSDSYEFTIPDINFPKTAGTRYPLTVKVEKINGLEDENPADNTQTATLKVWNMPQNPIAVATTPTRKNAVIEEYTGIYCQYCPDGHKRVNQILAANPERVCAINIHQGGYAAPPDPDDPDYTTQWGDALADQTGLTGYPAATISRHVFSGSTVTASSDRGKWTTQVTQILGQNSYVNVAVRTSVNEETRKLTAIVELYYTGNGAAQNNLNVAVLQDSIIGPQIFALGLSYPEMQPGNGLYQHNHMLRDLLSGQWGDVIGSTAAGTFTAKKYEWDIPAAINDVPVNPAKLEVVAFVSEGRQEIISGASSRWSSPLTGLPAVRMTDFSASIRGDLLHIESSAALERVTVYNISGQKVLEKTAVESAIPVSQLQPGVYIVKVKIVGGGEGTAKVIK